MASHRFEIKPGISEIGWAASAAASSYSEREIPKIEIDHLDMYLKAPSKLLKKDAITLMKVNFVKLFEVKMI